LLARFRVSSSPCRVVSGIQHRDFDSVFQHLADVAGLNSHQVFARENLGLPFNQRVSRRSVFHRKRRVPASQPLSQRRIQRIERQRVGGFVVDRDAGVVIPNHAADKPGNYRKQFLQVAVCDQCVVDFQQHVESFFLPYQGFARQSVFHRHGDQFCHAWQKTHVLFAVSIGLRTAKAQRAQTLFRDGQRQPTVGPESFLAQHCQHRKKSRVRRQVGDNQRLLVLPGPPRG
jgi:hypothetical protein